MLTIVFLITLRVGGCETSVALLNNENLRVAADTRAFWSRREEAATKLVATDRAILRAILVEQVRDHYDDVTGFDAIAVLGVVGDMHTVKFLEDLQKGPVDLPDKINTVLVWTVDKIKAREANGNP